MSLKRNRLDAGYELEPRVMLSGSIPGAETPVSSEAEAPVEETAADDAVTAEDAATEEAVAEEAPVEEVSTEEVSTEEALAEEEVAEEEVAPVAAEEAASVVAEEEVSAVPETGVVIDEGESGVAVNNGAGESITSAATAVEINGEATINNAGDESMASTLLKRALVHSTTLVLFRVTVEPFKSMVMTLSSTTTALLSAPMTNATVLFIRIVPQTISRSTTMG